MSISIWSVHEADQAFLPLGCRYKQRGKDCVVGHTWNCPELTASSEPIANVINYLTNRTWHKAAEKSLKDASINTVGDLCKLTELQASTLKGIKPPNNIQTIREAMKKFEKLLTKREKISQANSALKEDESEGGQLSRTSSNSSLASIIETSTPDEEDKMMKVYYTIHFPKVGYAFSPTLR